MKNSQFALLKDRRFLPLFVTQFLGAFHDNLFKNALVILLLYDIGAAGRAAGGYDPKLLVTLAAGLFILPFVLFSALGGQLADKYPKERLIRRIKAAEIGIACAGAWALMSGYVALSFIVLFALGVQSAFFGPGKYALLPQHLRKDELIGGNALLVTGTFIAILCGTIIGAVTVLQEQGREIVGMLLLLCAAAGYLSSRFIPSAPPPVAGLKLDFNLWHEIRDIVRFVLSQDRHIARAIIGVGCFYFLGGLFMAQFPNYTKEALGADEQVLAFFLVLFSIGVSCGGLLNNRLLKGEIGTRYVPWALLGIAVFSSDLYFAAVQTGGVAADAPYTGLTAFLSVAAGWRIIFDVIMIALCGGLYVVPLNAIIQHYAPPECRARILAGSAIVNALFIMASSVLTALMITAGWRIETLFLAVPVFCLAVPARHVLYGGFYRIGQNR